MLKTSTLWNLQIFLKKIKGFNIKSKAIVLKITSCRSCRTTCNLFNLKKVKIQDFMDKKILFLKSFPYSLWAILATWLHLGAPQKLNEKCV
jgi:hypothetical protein